MRWIGLATIVLLVAMIDVWVVVDGTISGSDWPVVVP
jgi:hypothetical protein